jgi:pyruvate/2-oxoglutarate dehydrogenase complex dihydrolipoamide acyltransferase (E2) component
MKRAHLTVLAAVALVPVLLAGCGSSSSDSSSSTAAAAESSAPPSESASAEPVESSSAPASSAAASEPAGEPLDRDAALVELERQVVESGFSPEAAACIGEWGTTLSDADLAVAAAPPGTSTPSPEQQAAQADILVQCARQEVIDLFLDGFADTEATETALACLGEYMNGLNDDQLRGILGTDETAMTDLQAASEACALAG